MKEHRENKKDIEEISETGRKQKDEKEEQYEFASYLLTRVSSIEFIEEFSGLSWQEIAANLNPEEIKSFYENRITEEEEKEAMAAWEKCMAYERKMKPERDFMNQMMYRRNKVIEEERREVHVKAVKVLLEEGYPIELIRKCTGLTEKEIEEIESE